MYVAGREHLSDLDQYVIIANHNSHLDVFLLFSVLPVKDIVRTHPVAAHEYFARWKPLSAAVNYLLQPIWIVRGGDVEQQLAKMQERLRAGKNVVMFPEGTRGSPGKLARFKSGVGLIAIENPNVPIVPAFLLGPERAFPRSSPVPLPLWNEVIIGPPQTLVGGRRDITAALQDAAMTPVVDATVLQLLQDCDNRYIETTPSSRREGDRALGIAHVVEPHLGVAGLLYDPTPVGLNVARLQ